MEEETISRCSKGGGKEELEEEEWVSLNTLSLRKTKIWQDYSTSLKLKRGEERGFLCVLEWKRMGVYIVIVEKIWIEVLGHMCFSCYRTNVMILCNWLILWQNALYLYLGKLRMCLTTSRNHVSRSSAESFKSVQEIKQEVQNH